MKISVIIPVYNVEDYLEECLGSLQNQTFKNFEALLINDGSTDSSLEICEKYSDLDERFLVFSKLNEGQGVARNFGLTKCSGEFVTFIDSDDYVDPDYLENLIRPIEKSSDVELVIGGYKKVDDNGIVFYREEYVENVIPVQEAKIKILGALPNVEDSIKGTVWNALYKKQIIQDNQVVFPSEREFFSEDTLFNIRYMQSMQGNTFLVASSAYCYRLNLNSTSTKYDGRKLSLINDYFDAIIRIYEDSEEARLRVSKIYLMNLKRALFQEKVNPENHSITDLKNKVSAILKDFHVQSILRSYPINKLNNKKNIVLFTLCRLRFSLLLSMMIWNDVGRDKRFVKVNG